MIIKKKWYTENPYHSVNESRFKIIRKTSIKTINKYFDIQEKKSISLQYVQIPLILPNVNNGLIYRRKGTCLQKQTLLMEYLLVARIE